MLGLAAMSAQALAQPNADALLQRQEEQLRQWRQRQEATPDVRLSAPAATLPQRLPDQESPCVRVRQVLVDAAGLPFDEVVLQGPDRDDPPAGRCLGAQGIALLVARAQDAFVDHPRFVG